MNRFDAITLPPALAGDAAKFVFDRDAARKLDHAAIHELHIPGAILMENAATAIAHVALAMLAELQSRNALILCGPGNNAGDGFALARKLISAKIDARIALLANPDRLQGDAALNLRIIEAMGLPIQRMDDADVAGSLATLWRQSGSAGLMVDALFGTGITTPPRPNYASAIQWVNAKRAQAGPACATLAVDIPSGLDCDTGEPIADHTNASAPDVVRADLTVTLGGMKRGLLNANSRTYTGRVLTGDLGAGGALCDRFGERMS